MSQNPTLINGFEDLMTFIKNQDHRIKELEEKNKKLQKYAQIMGDIDGDELTDLLNDYGWEYNEDGELEKREESK
jgi:hypothetical protein